LTAVQVIFASRGYVRAAVLRGSILCRCGIHCPCIGLHLGGGGIWSAHDDIVAMGVFLGEPADLEGYAVLKSLALAAWVR